MKSSKFLYVLKHAIRGTRPGLELELTADEAREVLSAAQVHGMMPLFFDALCRHPAIVAMPRDESSQYRQMTVAQTARQAMASAEYLRLREHLDRACVRPLVVKGIVCRSLWPMGDLRRSCDEDLFVSRAEAAACAAEIERFGLTCTSGTDYSDFDELSFSSGTSPLTVELHTALFSRTSEAYGGLNDYFDDAFERASVDVASGALTMCADDHLFYLVCHALKHFLHGGFGFRQICDILLYAERHSAEIDESLLYSRCRRTRTERFLAAIFKIGERHLGFEGIGACFGEAMASLVAKCDEHAMIRDVMGAGLYGTAQSGRLHSGAITIDAVSADKRGTARGPSLLVSLFPSARDLSHRYRMLRRSPYLLPIAWVHRALSFARRGGVTKGAEALEIGESRVALLEQYGIIKGKTKK